MRHCLYDIRGCEAPQSSLCLHQACECNRSSGRRCDQASNTNELRLHSLTTAVHMTENVPSAALAYLLASVRTLVCMLVLVWHCGLIVFSQYSMQIRDCNIVQHVRLCTRTEALPIRKVKCAEAPTLHTVSLAVIHEGMLRRTGSWVCSRLLYHAVSFFAFFRFFTLLHISSRTNLLSHACPHMLLNLGERGRDFTGDCSTATRPQARMHTYVYVLCMLSGRARASVVTPGCGCKVSRGTPGLAGEQYVLTQI